VSMAFPFNPLLNYTKMLPIYFELGLYPPLDGITNPKYKLMCFLAPNKKIKEKGTSF
jgi:hypothetical protein